jgi:hypothetical protein
MEEIEAEESGRFTVSSQDGVSSSFGPGFGFHLNPDLLFRFFRI